MVINVLYNCFGIVFFSVRSYKDGKESLGLSEASTIMEKREPDLVGSFAQHSL